MDRRVIKTRAAIRTAYFALLSEDEKARISVSEIARRADIDRKTFYLHYQTVEDISREYLSNCFEELKEELERLGFMTQPFRFETAIVAMNRMVERNKDFLRLLSYVDEGTYFWSKVRPGLVNLIVKLYADKVKKTTEEFTAYVSFGVSGILRLYIDYLHNPDGLSLDQLGRIASDIAYNGITCVVNLPEYNSCRNC